MTDILLALLLALLWGVGRRDSPVPGPSPSPSPSRPTTPVDVPTITTPPWPQTMPAGLPSWPSGWEPDTPVGPGVAARASDLLRSLWSGGAGTRRTEQTAGRWITYVATPMGSKRGVVAYRQRAAAPAAPAPKPAAPAAVPASLPRPRTALRTIRLGSRGPDVVVLQKRLGLAQDGIFGPKTRASVIRYQASSGLVQDGIVGPKTWASLMGRTA
jgi:hypothetical protein